MNETRFVGSAADQIEFLAILPAIEGRASAAFRHLSACDRDEATADAVAGAWLAYLRLRRRGKRPIEFPVAFARYAVQSVRNGRGLGRCCHSRDVLSPIARVRRGFAVSFVGATEGDSDPWWGEAFADPKASVPCRAAFNIDFPGWLAGLSKMKRRVVTLLGKGFTTTEVAQECGVSCARVSQLRRELARSWADFHSVQKAEPLMART